MRNPLRWYLLVLLLGIVLGIGVGDPIAKFQTHRLVELTLGLGVLAWCYRPQPRDFFSKPLMNGWYGLGLAGLLLVGVLVSAASPLPRLSLGFLGFAALQFALLPLLRPVWERHHADLVRLLALFGCVVLGMDVGFLVIDRFAGVSPYSWSVGPGFWDGPQGFPYLFQNSRWANQLSILLIWSFVPLLHQIQSGLIVQQKRFWLAICVALPVLAMVQIVLNSGDGAFLSLLFGALMLWWVGWKHQGDIRKLFWSALKLMLLSLVVAMLLSVVLDGGGFFGGFLGRNLRELASPTQFDRLLLWRSFMEASFADGFRGVGIPLFPMVLMRCITPHNVWLGLTYWLGLPGLAFAVLLTVVFIPSRFDLTGWRSFALPFLVSLFFYQLIDDIWLRPLSLSLLLVVLSALKSPELELAGRSRSRLLGLFEFSGSTYRLIALLGVLMIVLSVASTDGMAFARLGVSVNNGACLIFY